MARQLLQDTLSIRLSLVEQGENGKIVARGEFAKVDVPTANRRVYPRTLWERESKRLANAISERKVFGELDHPADGKTRLSRSSHIMTKLEVTEDGSVIGELEVMNTSAGKELQAIIEAGGAIGVSSRGYGSVKLNEEGNNVVQDDYQCMTFDCVADPAHKEAFPEFEKPGAVASAAKEQVEPVKTVVTEASPVTKPTQEGDKASDKETVVSHDLKTDKVSPDKDGDAKGADAPKEVNVSPDKDGDAKGAETPKKVNVSPEQQKVETTNVAESKDTDDIGAHIRSISSGTIATLTGKNKYLDIDKIQSDWFEWHNKQGKNRYATWQESWSDFAKEHGIPVKEDVTLVGEMKKNFETQLVTALKESEVKIRDQVRAELEADPALVGARVALERAKEALRPLVVPEDIAAEMAIRDEAIVGHKREIVGLTEKAALREQDIKNLTAVVKDLGFNLYLQKKLGRHPKFEEIVKGLGDLTKIESLDDLKSRVKLFENEVQEAVRLEADAQKAGLVRAESVIAELRSQLSEEVSKRTAAEKERDEATKIGLEMAGQAYLEKSIVGMPEAEEIRGRFALLESKTKENIDKLMKEYETKKRGESRDFERIRNRLGGRAVSTTLVEDSLQGTRQEDRPQGGAQMLEIAEGVSVPMSEIKKLAGMTK